MLSNSNWRGLCKITRNVWIVRLGKRFLWNISAEGKDSKCTVNEPKSSDGERITLRYCQDYRIKVWKKIPKYIITEILFSDDNGRPRHWRLTYKRFGYQLFLNILAIPVRNTRLPQVVYHTDYQMPIRQYTSFVLLSNRLHSLERAAAYHSIGMENQIL